MKKNISKVLSLAICLFVLSSAWVQAQSDTRKVSGFDQVKISGAYLVYLTEGNEEMVEIETQNIDPEEIVTEVNGDVLKIEPKQKNWKYNKSRVTIKITYKKLVAIHSGGASNIVGNSVIKTSDFDLKGSGSGDMKIKVDVNNLNISLSGSNDVEVEGSANTQSISISGSGDISAFELESGTTTVKISGSGDVDVNVSESLTAKISGSGDISYKGSPDRQDVKVSGSGSVKKVN